MASGTVNVTFVVYKTSSHCFEVVYNYLVYLFNIDILRSYCIVLTQSSRKYLDEFIYNYKHKYGI